MKKIEDILALCIEDIKAGRTTLEECLAKYPDMRAHLEPLLRLASSIQEPPDVKPASDFKIRARVQLVEYIHDHQKEGKPWITSIFSGLAPSRHSVWLKTTAIVLTVVVAFSALGTGTAYAAKDSLPGESLYPVKKAVEQVNRVMTFDEDARIELELSLAEKRLREMEVLAEVNPGEMTGAVNGYKENIDTAAEIAERNVTHERCCERTVTVAQAALTNISAIDNIYDIVPAEGGNSVRRAREITLEAQSRVLTALAVVDPVRATEINLETMRNRLRRADNAANHNDTTELEEALSQFERMHQFGGEISAIAKQYGHNTTVIDEINAQVVSEELEVIRGMHGKVNDETINSLEEAAGKQGSAHGKGEGGEQQEGLKNDGSFISDNSSITDNPQDESENLPDDPGNNEKTDGDAGKSGDSPQNPGGQTGNPGGGNAGPGSGNEDPGEDNGNSVNGKS